MKLGSLHKGEDLFEVGFVMGGPELFFREAAGALTFTMVGRFLQCIEGHATQGSQVLGRVTFASLVMVFPEEGVQNPVTAVFNTPEGADVFLHLLRLHSFQAAEVVVDLSSPVPFFVKDLTLHENNTPQIFPGIPDLLRHPVQIMADDGLAFLKTSPILFLFNVETPVFR
jgi:hypothetical protein